MPTVYCTHAVKLTIADLILAKSICSQTRLIKVARYSFQKFRCSTTLTCSKYAFLGFIQQILGFLYILVSLLSNYISFSNR